VYENVLCVTPFRVTGLGLPDWSKMSMRPLAVVPLLLISAN